jgi:hypothetical protein
MKVKVTGDYEIEVSVGDKATLEDVAEEMKVEDYFSFVVDGVPVQRKLWKLFKVTRIGKEIQTEKGLFDIVKRDDLVKQATSTEAHYSNIDELLKLEVGDSLLIYQYEYGSDWWYGFNKDTGSQGWFPAKCVHVSPPN